MRMSASALTIAVFALAASATAQGASSGAVARVQITPYPAATITPYAAPTITPYPAPGVTPYGGSGVPQSAPAPVVTPYQAKLIKECSDDGHFVSSDRGPIFDRVAGRFHAGAGAGVSTVDNSDTGIRTITSFNGASLGTLVIHNNGTYSWGTVRSGHLALYVPGSCFFGMPRKYHAFLAVNNGANWYFIAPGDNGPVLFSVKIDMYFGPLAPF